MTEQIKPLISIITICFNEPNVEQTCKSIISQSYKNFEWIVVDGASNKVTLDILNSYKKYTNVFISEPDNGRYHAMNKGIKNAKGEYLLFLNAGDYFNDCNVLENAVKENFDKDIVYGDLKLISDTNETVKKYPDNLEDAYFFYESLPHPSSFIKRELFIKYGLYNEDNKIVSDWQKWIEFIKLNNCTYKHINLVCSVFKLDGISSANIDLVNSERNNVLKNLNLYDKYQNFCYNSKLKLRNSLLEDLFSIKKINFNGKNYIIITFLFIKLKINIKKMFDD